MYATLKLVAATIASSLVALSAHAATPPPAAAALAVVAPKAAAPVAVSEPAKMALAKLKLQGARLARCLHGRAVNANVRLRVNVHGWTDVLEVTPLRSPNGELSGDGRVATCLRVIMEELHFGKGERAMFKGEVTVPVHLSSKFVLPRMQAAHATIAY